MTVESMLFLLNAKVTETINARKRKVILIAFLAEQFNREKYSESIKQIRTKFEKLLGTKDISLFNTEISPKETLEPEDRCTEEEKHQLEAKYGKLLSTNRINLWVTPIAAKES